MINDEMNNVFAKYDRYISHRSQPEHQNSAATVSPRPAATAGKSEVEAAPLIDFGGDNSKQDLSSQLAGMSKFLLA